MASTDRYSKQINSQSEFLTSCRNNLNDSFAELNALIAEVRAAGLESKLRLFMANKEYEMEVSFGKIAQEHCNKLIGLFKAETDQAREALSLSCCIAQEQFLLLRGNNLDGDTQLKEQQDALLTMLDNKAGVRFNDENLQDTVTQLMDLSEDGDGLAAATPQGAALSRMTFNVGAEAVAETKKRRNLFDDGEGGASSKVRIMAPPQGGGGGLDQTIVLPARGIVNGGGMEGVVEMHEDNPLNGTFQMPPARGSGALNETVNIVTKSVLKEQSLNKLMNQPGLVTKMVKATKGGGSSSHSNHGSRDNMARLGVVKKVGEMNGGVGGGVGGRSSPNRVAKARLAASRAGVAALKSKGSGGGGSAQKKWK